MPRFHVPKQADPYTLQEVRTSSHAGRIHLAHLTLTGKNWRNGTAPSNATLIGFDPNTYADLSRTYDPDVAYVVKSYDVAIMFRLRSIMQANKPIKNPLKLKSEWILHPNVRSLTPIQKHHGKILQAYLEPLYDWHALPPYVHEDGQLPGYMRARHYEDDDAMPEDFGSV